MRQFVYSDLFGFAGLKRPMLRLSVSQGIVEDDMSEQLTGFATALDAQSERWYPDDYCDSDTWDDDDDPGYHRQPIEDEDWFLANEIDYPSDVERSRHPMDKSTLPDSKQPKRSEDDDDEQEGDNEEKKIEKINREEEEEELQLGLGLGIWLWRALSSCLSLSVSLSVSVCLSLLSLETRGKRRYRT